MRIYKKVQETCVYFFALSVVSTPVGIGFNSFLLFIRDGKRKRLKSYVKNELKVQLVYSTD